MMHRTNPAQTASWKKLIDHHAALKDLSMEAMFNEDPGRAERFSIKHDDILIDYSKNRINNDTLSLLTGLAEECGLKEGIEAMFTGEKINETENRSVLHTALRNRSGKPVSVDGRDIMPDIEKVLSRMKDFSEKVINGQWRGYTNKPIESIVNIGIGGSDLGPVMVTETL